MRQLIVGWYLLVALYTAMKLPESCFTATTEGS